MKLNQASTQQCSTNGPTENGMMPTVTGLFEMVAPSRGPRRVGSVSPSDVIGLTRRRALTDDASPSGWHWTRGFLGRLLIAAGDRLGIAVATIAPSTLSLLRNMFHDRRNSPSPSWCGCPGSRPDPPSAPWRVECFGALLVGVCLLISVPAMVVLLITAPLLLPEYRDPDAGRLDLLSAALSLIAVLAVITGSSRSPWRALAGRRR